MGQETFLRVGIDGTGAQSGARVVTRSMDDISGSAATASKAVDYLQSALMHVAGTAVGVYGIATALQAIKNVSVGVLEYLAKIETATLGIAAAFLVSGQYQDNLTKKALNGQAALSAAQKESASVIEQLKVANFQTIATLDQLIFAYQVTLPVAMSAGFNKKQVMDYTLAMVQAAGAIGLSFDQIAEETRSMLTGNITRNSRIAQVLGLTNADVTAMKGNATGLFDMLMGRLSGFRIAGLEAQKTWAGLMSNTKDIALQLSAKAFEPVFNAIKEQLVGIQKATYTIAKDANGLQSIKFSDEFINGAKSASEFLKTFSNILISSAKFIYEHAGALKALAEVFIGFRLTMYAVTLAQKASNLVSLDSIGIENSRRIMAVKDLGIAAQTAQAEAKKTAAKVAYQEATLAENAALRASIVQELQSTSSTQAATTASYAKITARLSEAAVEVASLTAVKASIEAERQLIVTKMLSNDTTRSSLAMQEASLVAKQTSRAATIAETQQLIAQKQALIAKWESELFFEGRSLTQSAGLNLVKEQEINLRRSLTANINQAIKEEAALDLIRKESVATDIAKKQLINQLVPLGAQQNAIERQLSVAVAEHAVVEHEAASAATERALAAKKLVVAESAQVAIEANLAKAVAADALAQGASTVATDLHTAAIAAQTMGARIATGAIGALKAAMSYLGGPIGTIITLLGVAATAWFTFGKSAEDANREAMIGADDVLESLRKQNKELLERNRIQKATAIDPKDGKLNNGVFTDKEFEELQRMEKRKAEIEKALSKMPVFEIKTIDTRRITANAQDTSSALRMQLSQITSEIAEMKRLKQQNIELERQTEYKSNDKKEKEDNLGTLKKYYDSVIALTKSQSLLKIAGRKEDAKKELDLLGEQHSLGLVATEEYYKKKLLIEKNNLQLEIDANNATIKAIQNTPEFKGKAQNDDPKGLKAIAAKNEEEVKLNNAKTKGVELEKQQIALEVNGAINSRANNVKLLQQQDELNIRVLQARGDEHGAALASLSTQKVKLELTTMETELTAAAVAGDLKRFAVAKNSLELKREELTLAKELADQNERQKQAAPVVALKQLTGDLTGALAMTQAIERQSVAYQDLAKKGGIAFEAKKRLMDIDMVKARQDQENALKEIQNRNLVTEAQNKADVEKLKGNSFKSIDSNLAAAKAEIAARYEMERKAITDKIEMLEMGNSAELDGIKMLRDAQLAALDAVHQSTMAAIAAENEARYFNQPELLKQSRDAALAAEATYQKKMQAAQASSDTKIDLARVASEKQTTAVLAALKKSLSLLDGKQRNEVMSKEQQANNEKINLVSNYVGMAGSLFSDLADSQDQSSRKGFESAKAFSLAATIMNTAASIMAQLTIPGPVGWAGAALAAATGVIQIAKIASTSFGGGGDVSSVSSGSFASGGGASQSQKAEVGSSIGEQIRSTRDNQSEESLRKLAKASDNASLAMSRVADGLTKISDLFNSDYSKNLGKGLTTAAGQTPKGVFAQTWSDMNPMSGGILNTINALLAPVIAPLSMLFHAFGFGNSWQVKDSGLSLGIQGGNVQGQSYVDQHKDGGWFTSSKNKTNYTALDSGVSDIFTSYMDQIKSSISNAAVALGTSTDFGSVILGATKISTAGRKPEDIQKDLEAFFTTASNELAKTTVGLKEFAFYGEDAYTALMRLATSLQGVNEMLELTGHTLIESTLKGADAAYRLADAFGGIDKMKTATDAYFTGMFTETEQTAMKAAQATRQTNAGFAALGIAVPQTRADFIALVNSLDLTTDSGMSLYVSLMNLSPAFITMTAAAEDAAAKLKNAFLDTALSASEALKDIMTGSLSMSSPESLYKDSKKSFEDAIASGNTAMLPDLGKAFLEASKTYNASSSAYITDFQKVTGVLADVAGMTDSPSLIAANKQVSLLTDIKNILDGTTTGNVTDLTNQLNPWSSIGREFNSPIPVTPSPLSTLEPNAQADSATPTDNGAMEAKLEEMIQLLAEMAGRLETLETNSRLAVNQ